MITNLYATCLTCSHNTPSDIALCRNSSRMNMAVHVYMHVYTHVCTHIHALVYILVYAYVDAHVYTAGVIDVVLIASGNVSSLSALRALRCVRALRPLRLVARLSGMRMAVQVNRYICLLSGLCMCLYAYLHTSYTLFHTCHAPTGLLRLGCSGYRPANTSVGHAYAVWHTRVCVYLSVCTQMYASE